MAGYHKEPPPRTVTGQRPEVREDTGFAAGGLINHEPHEPNNYNFFLTAKSKKSKK
jgi:hypothetical protein